MQAKLTSTSLRDIKIDLLELHINPDYESFIQRITDTQSLSTIRDAVLKSGESYDCVFKLKIGVPPLNLEFGDLRSLMIGGQNTRSNMIEQFSNKQYT